MVQFSFLIFRIDLVMMKKSRRLSGEPCLLENVNFPSLERFSPHDKLPTNASIIGRIRYLAGGGKKNLSVDKAIYEVTKEVEAKYYHDTVYCKSLRMITKDIQKMWTTYQEGKKVAKAGRLTLNKAKAYVELTKDKDLLFDVSTDDIERANILAVEWGVKMGQREKIYLEDQKGPRLMSCDNGVDPVFYRACMKSQRVKERDTVYTTIRQLQFHGKTIDQIGVYLRAEGDIPSPSPNPESVTCTPAKAVTSQEDTPQLGTGEVAAGKKRRLFTEVCVSE